MEPLTFGIFDTPAGDALAARLETGSGAVVRFEPPQTEFTDIAPDADPGRFDWLIVCDSIAARALKGLVSNGDLMPDTVRVCAVGESAADALRARLIHTDLVIPRSGSPARAIGDYESGTDGLRILVVRGTGIDAAVETEFRATGAVIETAETYSSAFAGGSARFQSLVTGGALDCFVFSEPEQIFSLRAALPHVNLVELVSEISIFATDAAVSLALADVGLRPRPLK